MAAVVSSAVFATSAPAATTISGSITDVVYRDEDPGLVVTATPIAFPSFTLNNVGDFAEFNVLSIGTGEGTVNWGEDTTPYSISTTFSFTSPDGTMGSPVTGSTFGYIIPFTSCGLIAGGCGRVDWGAPSTFNFSNGGQFSVELFDASFGTPGSANVRGRFTLLAAPVPEPGTWAMMLVGFGAIGFAMRRQRHAALQPKAA